MSTLSVFLRDGTASQHRRAERTGIVSDMLGGRVSLEGYKLYLRNLYEIYAAMENTESASRIPRFLRPEFCRKPSICQDLQSLHGPDWQSEIAILDSAVAYRDRIRALAERACSAGLIAHVYVRYLGDLSGGQTLARLLDRHPTLDPGELSFYEFAEVGDAEAAKACFRAALDDFGTDPEQARRVVEEARRAFDYNIDLSCEAAARAASR